MTGPQDFAARLIAWQRQQGRHDLPWQRDRDPYRVWLSEIMLQQTQVSVVQRYFEPFLQRFPTVRELAAAELDAVLAQWSGLGYYRRARNLHLCAQQVCERHAGQFPRTQDQLQQLAGIGRSTAAAIAVFCFGERAAILDGNVKRVLGRAFGLGAAQDAAALRALWQLAESLLPPQDGAALGAYTQGLMDLGATLCKPRAPDCARCPFAADCTSAGQAPSAPAEATPSPQRQPRQQRHWVLLWAHGRDAAAAAAPRVWLERRGPEGIWPGLWCLPRHDTLETALAQAAELGSVLEHSTLPARLHVLTHLDLHLHPVQVHVAPAPAQEVRDAGGAWFELDDALALGLPAPVRRLLRER